MRASKKGARWVEASWCVANGVLGTGALLAMSARRPAISASCRCDLSVTRPKSAHRGAMASSMFRPSATLLRAVVLLKTSLWEESHESQAWTRMNVLQPEGTPHGGMEEWRNRGMEE